MKPTNKQTEFKRAQRRLSAQDRKAALLDAAGKIIRDRGVQGLTMESLAVASHVNKALPYRHFADRDDVLVALYELENQQFDAELNAVIGEVESFDEALSVLVRIWYDNVRAGKSTPELLQARTRSNVLETRRLARMHASVDFIADLIQNYFEIPRGDARLAASVLFAGSQGLAALWQTTHTDPQALADSFVKMSVGAVQAIVTR